MKRPRKLARKRTATSQEQSASTQEQQPLPPEHDAAVFAANMAEASHLWQQILQRSSMAFLEDPGFRVGHADPMNIAESFIRASGNLAANPGSLFESGLNFWKSHLSLWQQTTHGLLGRSDSGMMPVKDRRFSAEEWENNAWYDYLRRGYLINSKWVHDMMQQAPGLDSHTARKVEFFTRQFLDAASPSNFLLTNPEVLRLTLESNGENLVKGLQHMLEDVQRGDGKLRIRMTDDKAFTPGENIACTPGQVIFENDLMQLIQYSPTTDEVYEKPLLMIPAWINKFYVLDLQPKNSLVRWLVDQGYTVFMISWVNPDEEMGRKCFDDYLSEGPLQALDVIEAITGSKQTNIMAYCLGGTLAAITLSHLRSHGRQDRVGSVTFLTTMVDFTEAGDLSVFIDEEQLENLEERMHEKGYLEASDMANTFNLLRANDLIWSFVVNNYLKGKEPFPFDLLYWNSDSTRMPARMHSFYLRNMYQKNLLARPGGIELLDTPVNITKIETPSYLLSTKEDHIAPWKSTYAATQIYDGPLTFTLAESGHIAGVVNPPSKQKYGYWTNENLPYRPETWLEEAQFHPQQSWWLHWDQWQQPYAGKKVKARTPGSKKYPPVEPAPGAYVRVRS